MINNCIIAYLNFPSGYSPNAIDSMITPDGKEVVITYIWPRAMTNPMAPQRMNPGACETLQYSDVHVRIAAFATNVSYFYELNDLPVGQQDMRLSSKYQFLLPFAMQLHFIILEDNKDKKSVEVVDKHIVVFK